MSLAGIAKANQTIFDDGHYTAPSGRIVELSDALASAVSNTRIYTPDELTRLLARTPRAERGRPELEVVEGKTGDVGRALAARIDDVPIILNFASARNPGGGYVRGAKAQEEDLARCSGLHPTLLSQSAYYDINRKTTSLLYTDHIIVSPRVPFFRDDAYRLLEAPTLRSVDYGTSPQCRRPRRSDGHGIPYSVPVTLTHPCAGRSCVRPRRAQGRPPPGRPPGAENRAAGRSDHGPKNCVPRARPCRRR